MLVSDYDKGAVKKGRHTLAENLGRYAIEFVLQLVQKFVDGSCKFGGACGGIC